MNTQDDKVYIASLAVATPPLTASQAMAKEFMTRHYKDRLSPRNLSLMHKILEHPSILKRSFAYEDPEQAVNEDPDSRIKRFTRWSVELSENAILKALGEVNLTVDSVSALVVNTCTGYICPGISTYLIEKLGLSPSTKAYDLVGSGCGGAIPNLQIAESILKGSDDGIVLSVSVEICSATFQMEDNLSLIVSNALFADGAAASVLWKQPEGLEIVASASRLAPEYRDAIRYVHKNGQLHNQLSLSLHNLIKKPVKEVVMDLMGQRSLAVSDIRHWALHSGGAKIIDAVKNELGLSEEQVKATRNILAAHGNMSSPTVWFVLRELLDNGIAEGEWCLMVGFGAGLSAHAYLLRKK